MTGASADDPLSRLATFAAALTFSDIPAPVIAKAKVHLLDTLGAALAGACSAEFRLAGAIVADLGGGAGLWGTTRRVGGRDAALVNGVAAHVFELDDTGGCDHSGAVVVPAVLAAASAGPEVVSGQDLLVAIVCGYEVGRRVLEASGGYGPHNEAGWHSTGTCGTMAAAAAVARLWRFSPERMAGAIALATSFSSGLWAFIHDGSQAKKIHAGRAAEGGLLAAMLVRDGFTGPGRVFDDVWGGFFTTFDGRQGDLTRFTDGLGAIWKIDRVSLKPYASCRGTHSAVDCVDDILAASGRTTADIDRIDVRLSPMLMGMCGGFDVATLPAAQMSLPYALAARWVFGEAGLSAYARDKRGDPAVVAAMGRIRLAVDADMPAMDEPDVTLTFRDGEAATATVPQPKGSPQRPMSRQEIEAKFVNLAAMALTTSAVAETIDIVNRLEAIDDCRTLERALCAPRPAPAAFA